MSDFLLYWKPSTVDGMLASGGPVEYAASNQFDRLKKGDSLWLATVRNGRLFIVARFVVASIIDRSAAKSHFANVDLWEANSFALPFTTAIDHLVQVDLTEKLELVEFKSSDPSSQRLTVLDGKVNAQQLQTMRELSARSVNQLEELWSRVLRLAGSVATVESSVREFNATASEHRELTESLVARSEFWVYSEEDKLFAPAKFVGYSGMTFEQYEISRNGESLGSRFDGYVTRTSLKGFLGTFVADSALAQQVVSWAEDVCGVSVSDGVDRSKWRFVRIGQSPKTKSKQPLPMHQPEVTVSTRFASRVGADVGKEARVLPAKHLLKAWIVEALKVGGGALHHVRVAEHIWNHHEADLREAGDLFFTWQYDLRWAAQLLRDEGVLTKIGGQGDGVWRLSDH